MDNLIDAHPQSDPHFRVETSRWPSSLSRDEKIELCLPAKNAKHQLLGQSGILRTQIVGQRRQEIRRERALRFHPPQHFESDQARGRDHSSTVPENLAWPAGDPGGAVEWAIRHFPRRVTI